MPVIFGKKRFIICKENPVLKTEIYRDNIISCLINNIERPVIFNLM